MAASIREKIYSRLTSKSTQHLGLYFSGSIISKALAFVALPYFTYHITEKGFGILAIFSNSIVLLNTFILLSTTVTLQAEYFKLERQAYATLFSSLLLYVAGSSLLSMLLLFLLFQPLQSQFGYFTYYIWLLPLISLLTFFFDYLNALLRIRDESLTFFLVNIGKTVVEIGLAIMLIHFFTMDYSARIVGIFISFVLFAGYAFYYVFIKLKLMARPNLTVIAKEIPFGFALVCLQSAIFILGSGDKFFMKKYHGDDATGIYNMASTLATMLHIFTLTLGAYLTPQIFKALSNRSANALAVFKNYFKKYISILFAGALIIFLGGTFTYYFLIKPTFFVGYLSFCLLLVGSFIWGLANFFIPIFWYYRAKKILVLISGCMIVIGFFALNYATNYYMMEGAAIATILLYSLISIPLYIYSRRLIKINYPASS